MKNNVRGASHEELLKIIRSKNRKCSYESSKFLKAKRDLFMLVIENYPSYDSSELLKIIHYVRDSGFLIQSDQNFCKFIVPTHDNKILILNLRLEKYNHVAISGQIEENGDYEKYLPRFKGLVIDYPILFSERWNLTLGLDENDFKILKNKFAEMHALKDYNKIPITRNEVADRRKDYGKYVLKELRLKNLTQKSNKELDNGSGNSERDEIAKRRNLYARITLEEMKMKREKLAPRIRKITDKVKADPIFTFGKDKSDKSKNKKGIKTSPSVENKNGLYTNTTVAEKDPLDFTFGPSD